MTRERGAARTALAAVLLIALGCRLHNIGFGLPSMYDPDEPIFMITALKLLLERTLNPGWFGHPGSTTIYLLALIDTSVAAGGILSGRYGSAHDFATAAYANPAILFVPARVAMALMGVGCVWLTYLVGKRVSGATVGLIAAALLAVNAVHIEWSQVIRTDVHASLFMLASILFSLRAAESGKWKDYLLAAAFAGFGTATKWPTAIVFIGLIGAAGYRSSKHPEGIRREALHVAGSGFCLIFAIFVASPYIFLDWQTVLANMSGEAVTRHLAHTGGSFAYNLEFYLWQQVGGSMGLIGLLLAIAGAILTCIRSTPTRWTLIPVAVAYLILICSHHLIQSRWVVPLLPIVCIFAAVSIRTVGESAGRAGGGRWALAATALMFAIVLVPSLVATAAQARERANDTRAQAARWAVAHIPPGKTVVFEHLELSVRHQPWRILFPLGEAGCIDGVKALNPNLRYEDVQKLRNGSRIVDLGNVAPDHLRSCKADFAILTFFDLYVLEAKDFPKQMETYRQLLAGGRTVALFRPQHGRTGGPVVRIVALP